MLSYNQTVAGRRAVAAGRIREHTVPVASERGRRLRVLDVWDSRPYDGPSPIHSTRDTVLPGMRMGSRRMLSAGSGQPGIVMGGTGQPARMSDSLYHAADDRPLARAHVWLPVRIRSPGRPEGQARIRV
jgi:hypothetical protein